MTFAQQTLMLLNKLNNQKTTTILQTNTNNILHSLNQLEKTEITLHTALDSTHTLQIDNIKKPLHTNLNSTLAHLDKLNKTTTILSNITKELTNANDRHLTTNANLYLADARLDANDLDDTNRAISTALAHSNNRTPLHPPVLTVYARIALAREQLDEALELAEQAMMELHALSHVEDNEIAVHRALLETLLTRGDQERARTTLAEATTRLDALVAKLSDPTYVPAFLENVPAHRALRAIAARLG